MQTAGHVVRLRGERPLQLQPVHDGHHFGGDALAVGVRFQLAVLDGRLQRFRRPLYGRAVMADEVVVGGVSQVTCLGGEDVEHPGVAGPRRVVLDDVDQCRERVGDRLGFGSEEPFGDPFVAALQDRHEQVLLAAEMMQQAALGDADVLGDTGERRGVEAPLREVFDGDIKDSGTPFVAHRVAAASLGCGGPAALGALHARHPSPRFRTSTEGVFQATREYLVLTRFCVYGEAAGTTLKPPLPHWRADMDVIPDAATGTEFPAQAPSAPPVPASKALIFGLAFAQFGVMLALLAPVTVTLALRVAQIVPKDDRGAALGQFLALGAILAMIGNPVFGSLSDRTRSRFGRRRPWLIGGMTVAFLGLLLIAVGDNVPMLMLGWAVAQLGGNAALATVVSCVPDLVPEQQRGKVSGLIGMMTSVAAVTGSVLASAFHDSLAMAFIVPAFVGVISVTCLAKVMKDRPATPGAFEPYSLREFLRSFWVSPKRHPDFAWNFAGRFLVFTGIACVTSYQVYFLMDRLGYSEDEVAGKVLIGTVVMVASVVVGSVLGGAFSDRSGRRKQYVLGASLLIAVSLLLFASAHSFSLFVTAMIVFGVGQGLYLSVDVVLAAAVLPNPEESAKDMGVLNIGNALPSSLVPIVAPALLAIGAGGENYGALFLFGGVACVLGALAVQFVRSVR